MELIDSHCHPQMADYDADREAMLRRSFEQGIGMIAIGTTLADSQAGVDLAQQYRDHPIWAAVGVHPTDGGLSDFQPAQLKQLLSQKRVVAIGETGLDWYRIDPDDNDALQLQIDAFEQHILLAQQHELPIIVHTRDRQGVFDAYDQCYTLLRRHSVNRFVMHTYSGGWARAEKFLELGGYISVSGILTFPKSDLMQMVAVNTPLDKLLIETDAPFLSPAPERGQRNEPSKVRRVAEKLAELKKLPLSDIAAVTTRNTQQLFQLV